MTANINNNCLFHCAVSICLTLLPVTGCETKPKYTAEELANMPFARRQGLPRPSGGFALAVADETITAGEIIAPLVEPARPIAQRTDFQAFKAQAAPQLKMLIDSRISNILLYQQAKLQAGEQVEEAIDKAADTEVNKFIASFGGDYAKAEDALRQMQLDWKTFKDRQKKIITTQSYISSRLKDEEKPITYSQMLEKYDQMKDQVFAKKPMIRFRLIDIQPSRLSVTDPNTSAMETARNTAAEVMRRLSENADFAELAKQYSHGYRSGFGGLWNSVNPDSLAQPYDILAEEAMKISPGRIAGPIETADHIFIMKLEEKQPLDYEPFDKVQDQLRASITFERRNQAAEKVRNEIVNQAQIAAADEFLEYCLEKLYTLARQ